MFTCAMFTSQASPVWVTLAVLLVSQCVFAQYGSSAGSSGGNGYRKSGQSIKSMPLEMMIFSQMGMTEPKSAYNSGKSMPKSSPAKGGYGGGQSKSQISSYGDMESSYQSMPVRAAVKSTHTVEHRDVPTEPLNIQPQTILVEAMNVPLNILFQSKSSQLNLQSEHIPSQGSTHETESQDEPHILKHTVTKPILQNVFEVITPYRKIIQEIKPVQEEIQTIVARQVPSENKYEAVNNGKYNSMGQQQSKAQTPKSYSGNEQMLSQMMKALKMEIPKQFLQMGGYGYSQPPKQSRMQMYMNQMNEQQQKPETFEQEPENSLSTGTSKVESLPLELAEPELKEEEGPASKVTVDEVSIGEEQEVNAGETSTQASLQAAKKGGMPTIMFYSGQMPIVEAKQAVNGAAKIGLLQKSFLQSSNVEPTGY